MKELRFSSHTVARLPSGTYLFFPSLEERAAAGSRLESATIVAYDHPPHSLGALATPNVQLGLEASEFEQLERNLERDPEQPEQEHKPRDLSKKPFVLQYEPGPAGEVLRRIIDAESARSNDSYIRGLQPPPPPSPAAVGT
jgi:hypothetical protein